MAPSMDSTSRRLVTARKSRVAILVAALVVSNVAGADLVFAQAKGAAADPSDANTKKGIELYKKGQTLHKAGKFDEALVAFRESNTLLPSPNTRLYVARCLVGSQKYVEAYIEFEAVIADAKARNDPKYEGAIAAANTERDEVATKIGFVVLSVSNGSGATHVSISGRDIPSDQWGKPIPVSPGSVDVSITTPPAPSQTQVIDVPAGNKKMITLDASAQGGAGPSPTTTSTSSSSGPPSKLLRPISYAALGVGVAGIVVFGVAGGLANASYGELDGKCNKGSGTRACPSNISGKIDEGKSEALAANVGLIVGGVGLAAGVTLFLLSRRGGHKDEAPKEAAHVEPVIGPGYLGVRGAF